jgi:hypothetical protein
MTSKILAALIAAASFASVGSALAAATCADDTDGDGIPDCVEAAEGRDPAVKDNDIFANSRLFAMQQYRDLLGREGEAAGITFWTSPPRDRGSTIDAFLTSPEFANFLFPVVTLYANYFQRIPDFAGVQFWLAQRRSGMSLAQLSRALASSDEFRSLYGSLDNLQFVTVLYQNVMGRAPDAPGLAFWVGQLDSGTMDRSEVILRFSQHPEASKGRTVGSVTVVYMGMLRRSPEPAELSASLDFLRHNQIPDAFVNNMLALPEYHNRFLP